MNPTFLRLDVASADRKSSKAFLKNRNYDVIATDSARFARQMCLRLEPYFVLFDDHPPRVRGAEVCRRRQDPSQRTPVVLVSSKSTPAELVEGRQEGAADFSGTHCFLGHGLGRIEFLLRRKSSIDARLPP